MLWYAFGAMMCYKAVRGQPHSRPTERNNVARSEPEYETGTRRAATCPCLGLPLSFASVELAGKTGLGFLKAQKGNLRARVFLAWTQLSRGNESAQVQSFILAAKTREESTA
jgi:hypothetical protein